jgi:hypothetical protein
LTHRCHGAAWEGVEVGRKADFHGWDKSRQRPLLSSRSDQK